jgi:hypothetical protein
LSQSFWNHRDEERLRSLWRWAVGTERANAEPLSADLVQELLRVPIEHTAAFVAAVEIVRAQLIVATTSVEQIHSDMSASAGSGSLHPSIASTSTGSAHVQRASPHFPTAAAAVDPNHPQLSRTDAGGPL